MRAGGVGGLTGGGRTQAFARRLGEVHVNLWDVIERDKDSWKASTFDTGDAPGRCLLVYVS